MLLIGAYCCNTYSFIWHPSFSVLFIEWSLQVCFEYLALRAHNATVNQRFLSFTEVGELAFVLLYSSIWFSWYGSSNVWLGKIFQKVNVVDVPISEIMFSNDNLQLISNS